MAKKFIALGKKAAMQQTDYACSAKNIKKPVLKNPLTIEH